ncbi:glycoside hydrolase family 127 protein [Cohnella sp. LGH]|uniref:glycoside hydrolase family 127 protein n=1 Tax=Cohnella sp. LGH TaxID=1619153 RepID=UPI001ADCAF34|nr:beta-L-arabinofuranosidase domain-containing protein [Cohnella sp. LGH]QTH43101.1 glycoside hydrolase family 127 protein [Cohnella sp. LGH]
MPNTEAPLKRWKSIPFTKVRMEDGFWRQRLETVRSVTLPACLEQCETTGRIANFHKAGGRADGAFEGIYFNDSDVYKVLEGAAYSLMLKRDSALEEEIDRIIEAIASAQEPDGYLCTYFTLQAPDGKWTDMEKHEMYNGGHLIEAAVAYYEATGKPLILEVARRLADHYDATFGPGKRHWVEGHEEIELALVKLYRITEEERYWKLALWLLEERGHGHGVGRIWDIPEWGPPYCQDDVPVRDIEKVTGHAVRAMYLYTAMADVVHASGDPAYTAALHRVWAHTVERNMYITGGIGPSRHNEGFTEDYDLPNETAYCETCAAIAMAFWNHRMNLLFGDGAYADIVEREMYNGALAGISLSGNRFFYENPLASQGGHHRVEWYETSCCPTNLVRFLPSIGQYVYAATENGISVNQYVSSEAELELDLSGKGGGGNVRLTQTTRYPWDGSIALDIQPLSGSAAFTLRLRVPGWCKSYRASLNGQALDEARLVLDNGYLVIERAWSAGDRVVLELDMPVEKVRARDEVEANRGRVALQRGPLVYCAEQADNSGLQYDAFSIAADAVFATTHRPELLGGVTILSGRAADGTPCRLIPYYAWDNRDAGYMQVWIREATDRRLYRA